MLTENSLALRVIALGSGVSADPTNRPVLGDDELWQARPSWGSTLSPSGSRRRREPASIPRPGRRIAAPSHPASGG